MIFNAWSVDSSHEDDDNRADAGFVDKMRSKPIKKDVSAWLDRHDLVAGPLQKQFDRPVRLNNVVLLVLSKASIESD